MVHGLQLVFIPIITLSIFYCLFTFKYFWLESKSIGLRIGLTLIIDRVLANLLFLMKICLCYDLYLENPWFDGALGYRSNMSPQWVSCFMTANTLMSFFVTHSFKLGFLFAIFALLFESWIGLFIWTRYHRWQESYDKHILCGKNPPLSKEEKQFLADLGFQISNQIIGFGNYGTVYKCKGKDLAMKEIDIKNWTKQRQNYESNEAQDIRNKFLMGSRKMKRFNNVNIVKIESIESRRSRAGVLSKIYLFTKLANMNLDHYLIHESPHGVEEYCAQFWLRQLIDAVRYLHEVFDFREPLPHSNIKPENVLLFRRSQEDIQKNGIQFNAKLSDCGLNLFLPKIGKITTRKNPIYFISPPNAVKGKKSLRIYKHNLSETQQNYISDDIYSLGLVLLFMIKGNIIKICRPPKDTQKIQNCIARIDGIYAEFNVEDVKQLPGYMSDNLYDLLKKMLNRIQLLRININGVCNHKWFKTNVN